MFYDIFNSFLERDRYILKPPLTQLTSDDPATDSSPTTPVTGT